MEFNFKEKPGAKARSKTAYSGNKLLTIVTPFYNAGKYFEQTYQSVINQTFPWFEWIIVNDGSTSPNDTYILKKLASQDERIRVLEQENSGAAAARNNGIENAETDIIVPLDADDLISPQYLEYVFFGLYYNKNADWCYTDTVWFQDMENLYRRRWNFNKLKKCNFLTVTAAIRKQAILDVGGYKQELPVYYEDWRLWLDMLLHCKKPIHARGYLFWYRRTQSGSLHTTQNNKAIDRQIRDSMKSVRKSIKARVSALEYPVYSTQKPDHIVREDKFWDGYKTGDESKTKILMLISQMMTDKTVFDMLSAIDKDRFSISIMVTESSDSEGQQKLSEHTDEVFYLSDFLDPAHYLEFITYYVRTRHIDMVMIIGSQKGYYMLPWLRAQFPYLSAIDCIRTEEDRYSELFHPLLEKTYAYGSNLSGTAVHEMTCELTGLVNDVHGSINMSEQLENILPLLGKMYMLGLIEEDRSRKPSLLANSVYWKLLSARDWTYELISRLYHKVLEMFKIHQ